MTRPVSGRRSGALLVTVAVSVTACSGAGSVHHTGETPPATTATSRATAGAASAGAGPTRRPVDRAPRVTTRVAGWALPQPLSRAVAMPYAGGILLAGGLGPGDRSTDRALLLHPATGRTSPAGTLAEPLHDAAGGLLTGRPTVVGGGSATELDDVEQRSPSGRWQVVGRLPSARSDLSVVAERSHLVVIGGYDGTVTPTSVLRTSDGAHFASAARLPFGIRYAAVVRASGAVWILGGERDGRELDEVLRWRQGTGAIRMAGHLPAPLGHEAVVAVGDRLLVIGGRTGPDTVSDRMWWFRPRTGRWLAAGRLPYPVADAPAVRIGEHAYLLGGESPAFTTRVTEVSWGR